MTTATNHWKLGLFVVVAIGAMAGSLFWLGARRFQRDAFQAVSYFDESVQGLEIGSPVKFRGVTLGTVSDITIAPDHRHVQVTSDIYIDVVARLGLRTRAPKSGEEFIDPNLRVQLVSAGITGVRFLQTDFFSPSRYPPPRLPFEPPWNYVPSTPSTLKNVEEAAVEILDRLPAVEEIVIDAAGDLRKTLASIEALTTALNTKDGSFNTLLVQLRSAAAHVQSALDDAKLGATTASLRDTSGSVGQAVANVSDVRDELRASLVALREALESVRTLADSLERDPSTLIRGARSDALPARKPH
ncbi:MAG: MCE family protein [Deltaproteobacteria bacterium]|nr:MCE family protein [Deltaproteobacteria bacterium]